MRETASSGFYRLKNDLANEPRKTKYAIATVGPGLTYLALTGDPSGGLATSFIFSLLCVQHKLAHNKQ